ncbi:hypothetical protein Cs7R123_79690 [Catellatospora sp. TT07R-123]|uniref:hypothetical protein n=1 Tax=Catellatospora sp. TT07R-123 TaxID=2733863 RepID=UPI001B11E805|nr:hypothetical protein [Catellatospora sp. TT07R-123]GHJ50627.1 hypothetical protein Cs7R123_79690 [Catellatospora sp. TT07R-123]
MMTTSRWLGYLSDESRVTATVPRLCDKVERRLSEITCTAQVFEAANLFALMLFRAGMTDDARTVCHAELAFALRRRGRSDWPETVAFAVQPQINLLRLDGYAGDHHRGLRGLQELAEISRTRGGALPDADISSPDWAVVPDWNLLRNTIRDVVIADTCKVTHRRSTAAALLEAAAVLRAHWPLSSHSGAQHAYEAPYLVDAVRAERDGVAAVGGIGRRSGLTRAIQLCHLASQLAQAGERGPAEAHAQTAQRFVAQAGSLTLQSRLTRLRIRCAIADTLHATGHVSRARAEFEQVVLELDGEDPALACDIVRRLGGPDSATAGQAPTTVGPERVRILLDRVMTTLTDGRH